ncbi:PDDEXK nuclease domain-containing protein [Parabacteroides distasonis]|uniref:PDDEXK nuclease domain-containing protein n=1 Tax=Parabacteroides distasonis TaxID=823 RepID=UPI0039B38764
MDISQNYIEAVKAIKEAILRSQYRAAASVNKEQLSLYYGIGRYVSENSRKGFWGKGAIEQISSILQKELPGLRGFSASNIKNMRIFYEAWESVLNRQPLADDLVLNEKLLLSVIRQPLAGEFNWTDFLSIGFSHHTEIIAKAKGLDARLFYIHECATRYWNKYTLRDYLKADLYHHRGVLPNNFAQTLPDTKQAIKAICSFKDDYLLDFINIEELDEQEEDINERVIEKAIVANVKKFIMTFGQDFSFIGNQYRIEVAGEEMFIDLLFFNRELNSLVAVELKSGKFRSSYLGQLNTYLSALDSYVRKPHENPSIGIILCREMNQTFVEFAVRDYNKPMGVATYRASEEMPERLRKALPDIDELKKLL